MKYTKYLVYALSLGSSVSVFSNSFTNFDYVTVTNLTSCTELSSDDGRSYIKSDFPVTAYSFYYIGNEAKLYNQVNVQQTVKALLTVNPKITDQPGVFFRIFTRSKLSYRI